jgi:hypothetical protein
MPFLLVFIDGEGVSSVCSSFIVLYTGVSGTFVLPKPDLPPKPCRNNFLDGCNASGAAVTGLPAVLSYAHCDRASLLSWDGGEQVLA